MSGYRSGELARLTGLSKDSLRHYERIGVLPAAARTDSGYRIYPPEALERVRTVRQGVSLGISLRDMAQFLAVRDSGGAPCRQVRAALAARIDEVTARIEELQRMRSTMAEELARWDARLEATAEGERAHLLAPHHEENQECTSSEPPSSRRSSV